MQILTCWDRLGAGPHGGWEELMWRYRLYLFLRRKIRIAFLTFMCYAALCLSVCEKPSPSRADVHRDKEAVRFHSQKIAP